MTWTGWAPGTHQWLAALPRGRGFAAVRYPSGNRRGRTGLGEQAGRSCERSPSEMRQRSRRRRRRKRTSKIGSPLLRPASWPPPPGSSPPVWLWCRSGRSHEHLESPGGRRCVLWSYGPPGAALSWGSLSAARHHWSAWKTGSQGVNQFHDPAGMVWSDTNTISSSVMIHSAWYLLAIFFRDQNQQSKTLKDELI